MFVEKLTKIKLIQKLLYLTTRQRMLIVADEMKSYLHKTDTILDLGAGLCYIDYLLKQDGYQNITVVDIGDYSIFPEFKLITYDGEHLPFKDNTFDICLLVTVLHHAKNPEQVLKEAKRVAKKVVLKEDIYKTTLQKYLTYIMDSTVNFEFFGHPHANKDDTQWKTLFQQLHLKVVKANYFTFWKFFYNGTYLLEHARKDR